MDPKALAEATRTFFKMKRESGGKPFVLCQPKDEGERLLWLHVMRNVTEGDPGGFVLTSGSKNVITK